MICSRDIDNEEFKKEMNKELSHLKLKFNILEKKRYNKTYKYLLIECANRKKYNDAFQTLKILKNDKTSPFISKIISMKKFKPEIFYKYDN